MKRRKVERVTVRRVEGTARAADPDPVPAVSVEAEIIRLSLLLGVQAWAGWHALKAIDRGGRRAARRGRSTRR